MKKILIIIIAMTTLSCSKTEEFNGEEFLSFEIGKHYTWDRISTKFNKDVLVGKFILDSSCEYELEENVGQINKLVGFGARFHHKNSIRIGWNWDKNKYNLFAYYYSDGEINSKYITSCISNKICTFTITKSSNGYFVSIDGEIVEVNANTDYEVKQLLLPYFGGEAPFEESIHGDKKCKVLIKLSL